MNLTLNVTLPEGFRLKFGDLVAFVGRKKPDETTGGGLLKTLQGLADSEEAERLRNGILDLVKTGAALEWTGTLKCGRVSHAKALEEIAKLNTEGYLGHDDWRLPEIGEHITRIDYSRHDPATNDPDVESGFHWSNTAYAPHPADCAWGVNLDYGDVLNLNRDNNGFVRAVRGPVARPGQ